MNKIQRLIDDHRQQAYLTCTESCWCWDALDELAALEALAEAARDVNEWLLHTDIAEFPNEIEMQQKLSSALDGVK